MKIKIVLIDFETPKWLRKTIAYGAPVIGVLIVGGLALAAPHQWNTNDPLKASDLNGLNVATVGTVRYSVGATKFCGAAMTPTSGAFFDSGNTGYPASKSLCEKTSACNSSPTAHMCTGEELVRSHSLGITGIPIGWYSSGVFGLSSMHQINDCQGWTVSTTAPNSDGATWGVSSPGPGSQSCSTPQPILCCD
jgi:hypothetical protein